MQKNQRSSPRIKASLSYATIETLKRPGAAGARRIQRRSKEASNGPFGDENQTPSGHKIPKIMSSCSSKRKTKSAISLRNPNSLSAQSKPIPTKQNQQVCALNAYAIKTSISISCNFILNVCSSWSPKSVLLHPSTSPRLPCTIGAGPRVGVTWPLELARTRTTAWTEIATLRHSGLNCPPPDFQSRGI